MKLKNGKEVDPLKTLSEEDLAQVEVLSKEEIEALWKKCQDIMDQYYRNCHTTLRGFYS